MKLIAPITCVVWLAACSAPLPETVLVNGKIFTSNPEQPWAEALAIRGERVVAIGATATIAASAGPATRRIDLGGRTVVPGFNDAHVHVGPQLEMQQVAVPDDPTAQQVADAIGTVSSTAAAGVPLRIQFGGRLWDDPSVDRAWLDTLVKDRPVVLSAFTGHGAILNSAGLALAGIDESIGDPEGGRFLRDASGRLNGRAEEYADLVVWRALSEKVPPAERPATYRRFSTEAARFGITSVQLMANGGAHQDIVADVVAADSPLRWRVIRWPLTPAGRVIEDSKAHLPPQPAPRVDARGMKWMLDGTPIERLAAMREPYRDRPSESGRLNFSDERIAQFVGWAYCCEDPIAVHAVGDRAIETFIAALERGGHASTWVRKRPRLEHGDMLMPDLMPRAKALGIVIVQNPAHLMLREPIWARWGPERAQHAQPMKSLLDAGIPLAIGSDGPLSPFLNILFATTHAVRPPEALTREQAVTAYTYGSAFAEFAERDKGRLMSGALADLAVLSADLFTIPPDQLPSLQSVLTLVGGRPVYNAGLWQP